MPIFNSNVYTGREGRDMLMRGVNIVADAVRTTLGSKGSNAVLQESVYPFHSVTNDGISIAQKVSSSHPVEAMGVSIMKEVADRANRESGDGTTTAMVLAQAILEAGSAAPERGVELMRSLNECLPLIDSSIDVQKKDISESEVAQAASISAEDPQLGKTLQDIYVAIGKDGIVEIEPSGTFETSWEASEGIRFRNAGFLSPYMANQGQKAVYKDPAILVARQRIATLQDIDGLFGQLSKAGINELVMLVDDIDLSVVNALAFTHAQGIFKTLIIKAPTLWKDWVIEDMAKVTGATIVESASGVTWKTLSPQHLGTCEKLTSSKDETVVVGIRDISEHVKALEAEGTDDSKLRLAWLKTKAATLKLGAPSESELRYKTLKAEDARNASYLALKGGIVPGGGVALKNAAKLMPNTPGGKILRKALYAPIMQIIRNAGATDEHIEAIKSDSEGFDSTTLGVVDMWAAGIVDPALVVKNSVRTAISIAGTVLTTETIAVAPKV